MKNVAVVDVSASKTEHTPLSFEELFEALSEKDKIFVNSQIALLKELQSNCQ